MSESVPRKSTERMSECFLVIETAFGLLRGPKAGLQGPEEVRAVFRPGPKAEFITIPIVWEQLIVAPEVLPAPVSSHVQEEGELWIERLRISQADGENEVSRCSDGPLTIIFVFHSRKVGLKVASDWKRGFSRGGRGILVPVSLSVKFC